MYQVENSKILHVTKKATGRKRRAYKSNCVVKERLKAPRPNHAVLAEEAALSSERKRNRGTREIKNAIFTAFFASKWKLLVCELKRGFKISTIEIIVVTRATVSGRGIIRIGD